MHFEQQNITEDKLLN